MIPCSEARAFADAHGKDIVLIVAWSSVDGVTDIVTWGREPLHKEWAAAGGEKIAAALNLGNGGTMHQDFRREGEAAAVVDTLSRCLASTLTMLEHARRDRSVSPALRDELGLIVSAVEAAIAGQEDDSGEADAAAGIRRECICVTPEAEEAVKKALEDGDDCQIVSLPEENPRHSEAELDRMVQHVKENP